MASRWSFGHSCTLGVAVPPYTASLIPSRSRALLIATRTRVSPRGGPLLHTCSHTPLFGDGWGNTSTLPLTALIWVESVKVMSSWPDCTAERPDAGWENATCWMFIPA